MILPMLALVAAGWTYDAMGPSSPSAPAPAPAPDPGTGSRPEVVPPSPAGPTGTLIRTEILYRVGRGGWRQRSADGRLFTHPDPEALRAWVAAYDASR